MAGRNYPASGDKDEYLRRCEEAAYDFVNRRMSYREIGDKFAVSQTTAQVMVQRWLRESARFFSAGDLRELLLLKYEQAARVLLHQLALLQREEQKSPERRELDAKEIAELRIKCAAKLQENVDSQAKLFGLQSAEVNLRLTPPAIEPTRLADPSKSDRAKLRALLRAQRAVLNDGGTAGDFREAIDAAWREETGEEGVPNANG